MNRNRTWLGLGFGAKVLVGGGIAVLALACGPYGSYRVVKKVPNSGGEVALQGDQDLARQKADAYMKTECGGGYDIVEEGEEVTGSQSTSSSDSRPTKDLFGRRTTNTQTSTNTVNTKEWRVKFKCKGGEGAPTEKASPPTPATPADGKKAGAIREVVIRF